MADIKYTDVLEEDILDALVLAKQFHKEVNKAGYPTGFDNTKVMELIATAVGSESYKAFFIVVDGEKVGFFLGCLHEPMFSSELFATEMFWWMEKSHRGTRAGIGAIKVFEDWAISHGVTQINVSDLQGLKSLEKLYNKFGYKLSEITYRKEL
tara:strand:- start:91 stop:549 length:459 start_codon:yes stop_codon:yes gene_type:complete